MVIDDQGNNLGEIDRDEALSLAQQKDLDLVEMAPDSRPPVCKIIDWGKFQYEQEKESRKQKARSKKVDLKEIRLSFRIGQHDLGVKSKQARKFIDQGDKVRIQLRLRGREMAHKNQAEKIVRKFIEDLGKDIRLEEKISRQGPNLLATVAKN